MNTKIGMDGCHSEHSCDKVELLRVHSPNFLHGMHIRFHLRISGTFSGGEGLTALPVHPGTSFEVAKHKNTSENKKVNFFRSF